MAHSVGMLGLHDYSFMDEIPTIDNSLLFPKDHNEPAKSLEHLGKACQEFDPVFFVSLVQDVNEGLQMLSHKANWITVNIPRNTIFVGIRDHLEILTNGKYKSHIHQVILNNNKVKRISTATLHGPSLDTFVAPAPRLIDKSHPPTYRGMTYKESLEFNGFDEIDMQSSLIQLRMPLSH
ncbi:2-oxoglutarate-dependent dioxygenase 21, chloroplastic-like [Gossypium arboreum]|uniref:2-oxoglutarate-dependent dioxygenase 21, chloroplastic-like n=1 Tax=Gossypium arboreum TaxID=29729 RepID=UPI0008194A23|nr:2-oxoglutarate-dependent dioxygenase 21, chloroplastic-like [Gossypium arboreum]